MCVWGGGGGEREREREREIRSGERCMTQPCLNYFLHVYLLHILPWTGNIHSFTAYNIMVHAMQPLMRLTMVEGIDPTKHLYPM